MGRVQIRYKGVFHVQELVKAVTDWFEKKNYEHYIYQTKTNAKTFGSEEEYGIKGWVNETEYHRLIVDVYIHIYDAVPVEITENGKKTEMTKARMIIKIEGSLQKDFADRFAHSKFSQKLRKFMEDNVLFWRYGAIWEDEHEYRIEGLGEYIKSFLKMNTQGKYF
ncbi:MAG: hypothetical protein ACQESF_05025 [Nanobdellota archaeon]